jgi:ABC-type transport system substrate-binding protein
MDASWESPGYYRLLENAMLIEPLPGLNDPAVRRAIAMSPDYGLIGTNAMSGYTAKMAPSLMLPVPAEQALIDNTRIFF